MQTVAESILDCHARTFHHRLIQDVYLSQRSIARGRQNVTNLTSCIILSIASIWRRRRTVEFMHARYTEVLAGGRSAWP